MNQVSLTRCEQGFTQWTDGAISTGEFIQLLLVHMGTETEGYSNFKYKVKILSLRLCFWIVKRVDIYWL